MADNADPGQQMKGIATYLHQKGLNEAQIKAMLSNIAVETGYTFSSSQKQLGDRSDPAYGLFQFDPRGKGLAKPYQKYLAKTGSNDSLPAQLDFMVDSLSGEYKDGEKYIGYGNAQKWRKMDNAKEATIFFSENILRPGKPHMDKRLQFLEGLSQSGEGNE